MENKKALVLLVVALVVIAIGTTMFLTMGKQEQKQTEVYTVVFTSDDGNVITSKTVESGVIVEIPTTPTKEGYSFGGW